MYLIRIVVTCYDKLRSVVILEMGSPSVFALLILFSEKAITSTELYFSYNVWYSLFI